MLAFSIIKADTGGHVSHSAVHHTLLATASSRVSDAIDADLLIDGTAVACGDDVASIMTHTPGARSSGGLQRSGYLPISSLRDCLKLFGQ